MSNKVPNSTDEETRMQTWKRLALATALPLGLACAVWLSEYLPVGSRCGRVVRISELAELTSFSSWYFSRTFYSLYDESPQAAAARMRLEHAAALLRDTSMMVGEVAAASGFDNCCSFARAFRARFGESATRYRSGQQLARTDSAKSSGVGRKAVLKGLPGNHSQGRAWRPDQQFRRGRPHIKIFAGEFQRTQFRKKVSRQADRNRVVRYRFIPLHHHDRAAGLLVVMIRASCASIASASSWRKPSRRVIASPMNGRWLTAAWPPGVVSSWMPPTGGNS